jgi:phage/plasmid-like protein (TIGR03299 family)
MSHQFTSGVFARNTPAWHGLGKVVESMTVEEAFADAEARFTVSKHPAFFPHPVTGEFLSIPNRHALVRDDNLAVLGNAADGYEIVQNSRLEEMAQQVVAGTGVEMDAVIVLNEGRKVSFTALLPDAQENVIAGDSVARYLVGWLGHDGSTGIGAAYTDVRAVCRNTLDLVLMGGREGASKRTLSHCKGANASVSDLIASIQAASRTFQDDVAAYQLMARTPLDPGGWEQMVTATFAPELSRPVEKDGVMVPRTIQDLRVFKHLLAAKDQGLGTEIAGVQGTVWGAFNSLTEVLGSTAHAANAIKNFDRAVFGGNRQRILVAKDAALALCR